jgi:hypothetical protein
MTTRKPRSGGNACAVCLSNEAETLVCVPCAEVITLKNAAAEERAELLETELRSSRALEERYRGALEEIADPVGWINPNPDVIRLARAALKEDK